MKNRKKHLFTVYPLLFTRKAFTLAEVLITLGIIGVVAAMTIPTLMNNVQDNEFHTAAKKAYSILTNATEKMVYENSGIIWNNSSADYAVLSKNMADAYAQYFSVLKEDFIENIHTKDWVGYKVKTVCVSANSSSQIYSLLLKDGTVIRFYSEQNCNPGVPFSTGIGTSCGHIMVDVNGNKTPNMLNRDTYAFFVVKDNKGNYRVLPAGVDVDSGQTCAVATCTGGCTESVINNQPLP